MIHIRGATEWHAPSALATAGHPMPVGPKRVVVLHHTWRPHRPAGHALSQERTDLRGVDRYHREQRWGGIGYHFAGFQSGNVYQCRPATRTGAHTKGQNSKSIGYVLFIDGDMHEPSEAAMESFRDWLRWAVAGNCITPDYVVHPHAAYAQKTCPGSLVIPLLPQFTLRRDRPLLMIGDRGALVEELQRRLVTAGHLNPQLVTNYFGGQTLDAVRAFQRANKLNEDGIVGAKTWLALGF